MIVILSPSDGDEPTQHGHFNIEYDALSSILSEEEIFAGHELWGFLSQSAKASLLEIEVPDGIRESFRTVILNHIQSDKIDAYCTLCGILLNARDLKVRDWESTSTREGIKAGYGGKMVFCPKGHNLLFTCEKYF